MAETKTLVWLKPINYSGLIDIKGLYRVMDEWFFQNHYAKVERRNFETVMEDGKQIIIELLPYKKITDYAKVEIRIYVELTHLKETVVERQGLKHRLYKGDAHFSFDCFLITDYEQHWETKAVYFFIRTIVDKYLYRGYTKRFEAEAVSDTNEIINEIKGYLNMERFK
jgi:hypothetical protein